MSETSLEQYGLTKERALDLLRQMWEIRLFEDRVYDLLGQNIIKGASHLYAGEEAVAAGAISTPVSYTHLTLPTKRIV